MVRGTIYQVVYVDSIMEQIHGMSYKTTVIHIPSLRAEINHSMIRRANKSYKEPVNGVKPKKIGTIEIDKEDANTISILLNLKGTESKLYKKYMDKLK